MARDHSRVNLAIWGDPDWKDLPPAAQHLYLTLWTSPSLTYCGTHDWRPARLAGLSAGWTADHIRAVARCLEARHFLVIDDETEEVLIRSWARFDGLFKQPRLAVSFTLAYAATSSKMLQRVMVHEVSKIRNESSDLPCWGDSRVQQMLSHPALSAKDLPPVTDPFGGSVGDGFALGLPQTAPKVWGSTCTPPTTSTATTTNPLVVEGGVGGETKPVTRKRATSPLTSLPDDFEPNDTNRRIADERGLDLDAVIEQWSDFHRAKGSTMKDWNAALNTWLRREKVQPKPANVHRLPHVSELRTPPPGLTDADYERWMRGELG